VENKDIKSLLDFVEKISDEKKLNIIIDKTDFLKCFEKLSKENFYKEFLDIFLTFIVFYNDKNPLQYYSEIKEFYPEKAEEFKNIYSKIENIGRIKERKFLVIKLFKKGYDNHFIKEMTGFSEKEINELRKLTLFSDNIDF
jgi:hypothetical protein